MTKDQLDFFKSLSGKNIEACVYISDYRQVLRSFKERLFTLPWRPFEKYKSVYHPVAYQIGDIILVSYQTCATLIKGGIIK